MNDLADTNSNDSLCDGGTCPWRPSPDDIYCGRCGRVVADLAAEPPEVVVYIDPEDPAQTFPLKLVNRGRIDLEVERVGFVDGQVADENSQWPADWGTRGLTIPKGQVYLWSAPLPPVAVGPPAVAKGCYLLPTKQGVQAKIPFQVRHPLDFALSAKPGLLVGEEPCSITVLVESIQGIGEIESVGSNVPWLSVEVQSPPLSLEPGVQAALTGTVDLANMPMGKQTANLTFRVRHMSSPIVKPIVLRRVPVPHLELLGSNPCYLDLLEGQRDVPIQWDLRNPPEAERLDLVVGSIAPEVGGRGFVQLFAPRKGNQVLDLDQPAALRAGESITIKGTGGGVGLPKGSHSSIVVVKWGVPELGEAPDARRLKIEVRAEVAALDVGGTAAIDFGTTSSCCAYWDERPPPGRVFVELESLGGTGAGPGRASATAVIYQRDTGHPLGVRPWLFGDQARGLASASDKNNRHLLASVLSIKRSLGKQGTRRVIVEERADDGAPRSYRARLTPKQIASHILGQHLGEKIIWAPRMRRRPNKLVVTVPAMFSPHQRREFAEAIKDAGLPEIDNLGDMVEEPVAAAAAFFFEPPGQGLKMGLDLPATYTLLVCDIGGGTTDICLLKVTDVIGPDGTRDICVEILAMGGNPRFGGDDVTERLARRIYDKCAEADEDFAKAPYDPQLKADPVYREVAEENRRRLAALADDAKVRLSDPDADAVAVGPFQLRAMEAGRFHAAADGTSLDVGDVESAVREDVDVIVSMIQGQLKHVRENLSAGTEEDFPDGSPHVLYLAGRTLNIPFILARLKEQFGRNHTIFDPKSCKECVVAGALLVQANREGGELNFRPVRKDDCSPTELDLMVPGSNALYRVIPQFGNLGEAYPSGSFPLGGGRNRQFGVYENYAPNMTSPRENNPFLELLGTLFVRIPPDVYEGARKRLAQLPKLGLRIDIKLESHGRGLTFWAKITDGKEELWGVASAAEDGKAPPAGPPEVEFRPAIDEA